MSPQDRDFAYIWDMLAAARDVMDIVGERSREQWLQDKMLRLAVERSIEIVGEAARRVSPEFQVAHPEIPWKQIIGQRNILAHEYGHIDYDQLYETAKRDIPALQGLLERLLPPK